MNAKIYAILPIIVLVIIIASLLETAFGESIFYSSGIILENGIIPSYICTIYPWLSC